MPEKQFTERFYQVNLDGRLFYKKFSTKEKARKFAKEMREARPEYELIEIYLIEETLTVEEEI